MKQYLMIILAVVLFGTIVSSCGKKTDEANMANKDSVATTTTAMTPSPTATGSVSISTATMRNTNAPGLYITSTNTTTASIDVTDTSGTTSYKWRAYYGTNNNSTLTAGNPSGGNSATWDPGSYNLPTYWFPQYSTDGGVTWTNFSSMNIVTSSGTTASAFGIASSSNGNIKIVIDAGGGEPGK